MGLHVFIRSVAIQMIKIGSDLVPATQMTMEEALNIITVHYNQSQSLAGDYKTKDPASTAQEILKWWDKIQ